ncbi:hypothetical protein [Segniliparus rugosus]|uniref:Uncharacterized protein n=1 Tax=Segniliparus rugosus (strain ATCC BAA-974 / DSM 45345 / CCUG 50838 / CIP 108380 / JCM 13579 / CDC 945) TaxID=679197 RepID=U1M2P2_SEGRC|nr:hypothetical protein [Segniliparus rugosus]ERG69380.1 hypothetical protein HMPREF9336_04076 [Segniliparus rugosus ATCC BAA-974]
MAEAVRPEAPRRGGFGSGGPDPTPEEKAERERNCLTDWRAKNLGTYEFGSPTYWEMHDWAMTWRENVVPHARDFWERYAARRAARAPLWLRSREGTGGAASPEPSTLPPYDYSGGRVWCEAESLRVLDAVFHDDLKEPTDSRYLRLRVVGALTLAYEETELYWEQRLAALGCERRLSWEDIQAHSAAALRLSASCVALMERRHERAAAQMRALGGGAIADYVQSWREHTLLVRNARSCL